MVDPKTDPKKEDAPKKIGVPTQKIFTFHSLISSKKSIDSKINNWLKNQTIQGGQPPMLVKLETSIGLFGVRLFFIYMYNTVYEIKKP